MSTTAKIVWALGAILSIVAGILCFCSADVTLVGVSIFLGIILLLSGLSLIATAILEWREMLGAGLMLVLGIGTVVLGILVFCNAYLAVSSVLIIFAIWLLLSGIARIDSAFDMRRLGFTYWWVSLVVGLVFVTVAILSFFSPIISVILLTISVGLYLVLNGVYGLVELYYANKLEKKAKEYINKMRAIVIEPTEVATKGEDK